jgi:predicted nucleotidyltransferase component of viral defense system
LFGLAESPLKEKLAFKGGTALRRCYFADYRFSEDLDFTIIEPIISLEKILKELENIFFWIKDESGILFSNIRKEPSSENTHTFYISYLGPLPGKEKEVKVDITFRETILKPIKEKNIIKTYEEYEDFLEEPKVKVYSLDEVAIEKICALFAPARNEPRDLYDLHYLIENENLDIAFLLHDVRQKMHFKGISFEKVQNEFLKKEHRLKNAWEKRLSQQMAALPAYDTVFRVVKRAFRHSGFLPQRLTP